MEGEPLPEDLTVEERVLLLFGYLGPLAFVALVASRREFVKWHAKQGLVLAGALAALWVVLRFVLFLLERYAWAPIAELFRAAIGLTALGALVALLVALVRGLAGERFKIPFVGDLADRL